MLDRRGLMASGLVAGLVPRAAWAGPDIGKDRPEVDAFVRETGFNGIVATARAGKIDYFRAFGMADVAAKRPARRNTVYAIASISKWLTSAAVLKLVEAGKLSLDASVASLLPDFRADTGAQVRLWHLLSNTSGIPNQFVPALKLDPSLETTVLPTADYLARFCHGDLAFAPGSRFDYAMTNWFVVTAIVEKITGKPFQAAMRGLVLDPLGLRHTGADDAIAGGPDTALSYFTIDPPAPAPLKRLPITAAGGGYYSNVDDLVRAAHLVFDTGFLAPASQAALRTIRVPEQDYALGGRVRTLTIAGKPVRAGWETGRTAGFRSVVGHRYDTRETVVLLNNTSLSQKMLDLFADKLFGAEPRPD
jgi:CubicO group peptidase (beta-lactamase class C family)